MKTSVLASIVGGVLIAGGLALALLPFARPIELAPDVWLTRGLIAVGLLLLFPWLGGRVAMWIRTFRGGPKR